MAVSRIATMPRRSGSDPDRPTQRSCSSPPTGYSIADVARGPAAGWSISQLCIAARVVRCNATRCDGSSAGSNRAARIHACTAATSSSLRSGPTRTAGPVGRRSTSQGCAKIRTPGGRSRQPTAPRLQPDTTRTPCRLDRTQSRSAAAARFGCSVTHAGAAQITRVYPSAMAAVTS